MPSVVFKIDRWNPAIGSKGALDGLGSRGIHEKRSFSNVCMVASKVGLPLEVGRENLNRYVYVRVKIGYRDVTKPRWMVYWISTSMITSFKGSYHFYGLLLLTRDNLSLRRKDEDQSCLFCSEAESVIHLFFECVVARKL
jgi:hypothetical protein